MKIRRIIMLAAVICLAAGAIAGAYGADYYGGSISTSSGGNSDYELIYGLEAAKVTPYSYTAQNEDSLFYRAMDGKRETVYQYVTWVSLSKDEIPEASFLFDEVTLTDLWIRNGRQADEDSYLSYARIKRLDVTVYTADGASWNWQYRLEDLYDPDTVSEDWYEGYQRIAFPQAVHDVTQVDLWIKGWYKGEVQSSQYKVCITDLLFASREQPTLSLATPTPTPRPWPTRTPAPTAVPATATPAPASTDSTGIDVTLKTRMETRSGPGDRYALIGSYFRAGAKVKAISSAYDEEGGIWWVQVEFTADGEKRRGYTPIQCLDMRVTQVPVEFIQERDTTMIKSVYGYYGPGYGYALHTPRIPAGTEGDVWETEAGYALFEYYDTDAQTMRRIWVPEAALEQSNG